MGIVLYRVDERLIHGQVVVGWGGPLRPDRFIVVDDELADSPWEQDLYTLGLPPGVTASFHGVDEARRLLRAWQDDPARAILLTRDLATMRRLVTGGALRGTTINIGGIHHAPGRRAILPYVYLNADEEREVTALADEGLDVVARDLPGARRVGLAELLRREGRG
ncbi:MAG TPA: PTS sugar transporter subunit IIB [Longimicrobiales bacterium]